MRQSRQWDLTLPWFLSSQRCHFLLQWEYNPKSWVEQYCTLRELSSLNKPIVTISLITREHFLTRRGWLGSLVPQDSMVLQCIWPTELLEMILYTVEAFKTLTENPADTGRQMNGWLLHQEEMPFIKSIVKLFLFSQQWTKRERRGSSASPGVPHQQYTKP